MNNDNVWIFLSHSSKDYEKVRIVRNYLEEQNLRPLMFFLHCLNDDEEISALIKREIDCRTRFILCDSANAQSSRWVQKEVEYIKSKDRVYETISLDSTIDTIKGKLKDFVYKTRIFVSYNREEIKLAKRFAMRMRKYEFAVYIDLLWDKSQSYEQDYRNGTISHLDISAREGTVVAFVNQRVINERYSRRGGCRFEITRALQGSPKAAANTIVFTRGEGMAGALADDPDLHTVYNGHVYSVDDIPKPDRCDYAVEQTLRALMTPGSILSQANNLKNGIGCEKDEKEAEWLLGVYKKIKVEEG